MYKKTKDSIVVNNEYKLEKNILKKKKDIQKAIEKRKKYLYLLRKKALTKITYEINASYEKKLAKFQKAKQTQLEKFIYTVKGKKVPKRLNKPKGVEYWKNKACTEFQTYIRLSKSEDGRVQLIDKDEPRRWNGCDAGHLYPKHNFPHMIFYEDNVRPQSKGSNKLQADSIGNWGENVKAIIGEAEYKKLVVRANNKELKNEYQNKGQNASYWEEQYNIYHEKVVRLKSLYGIE